MRSSFYISNGLDILRSVLGVLKQKPFIIFWIETCQSSFVSVPVLYVFHWLL